MGADVATYLSEGAIVGAFSPVAPDRKPPGRHLASLPCKPRLDCKSISDVSGSPADWGYFFILFC